MTATAKSSDLLLENFDLLDVEAGVTKPTHSLLIQQGRIAWLEPGRARAAPDCARIDLQGRVLMPGLIDCHVHILQSILPYHAEFLPSFLTAAAIARLGRMLDRGFTTVRDAGGADAGHRRAIEKRVARGPRLFVSGRALSQTGGHGDSRSVAEMVSPCGCAALLKAGIGRVVDGVPAVLQAVRDEIRLGADQIKLMAAGGVGSASGFLEHDQFSDAEILAIVDEAVRSRRYVMAHVYSAAGVKRLVSLGIRTIEHGNLLDDEGARMMRDAGAYLVPNLVIYEILRTRGQALGFPEEGLARLQTILEAGTRSLELATRYDVKMGYGTDLVKPEAEEQQSDEFLIRGAFMPAIEVIRSATLVGAEIVRKPGKLGIIQPGAYADLIAVDGNPLEDLALLTRQGAHIPLVIKDGWIEKNTGLAIEPPTSRSER